MGKPHYNVAHTKRKRKRETCRPHIHFFRVNDDSKRLMVISYVHYDEQKILQHVAWCKMVIYYVLCLLLGFSVIIIT